MKARPSQLFRTIEYWGSQSDSRGRLLVILLLVALALAVSAPMLLLAELTLPEGIRPF